MFLFWGDHNFKFVMYDIWFMNELQSLLGQNRNYFIHMDSTNAFFLHPSKVNNWNKLNFVKYNSSLWNLIANS